MKNATLEIKQLHRIILQNEKKNHNRSTKCKKINTNSSK